MRWLFAVLADRPPTSSALVSLSAVTIGCSSSRSGDRGALRQFDPVRGVSEYQPGAVKESRRQPTADVEVPQELYRDDKPIDVSIAAGEVPLAGEVCRQDEAEILPRMVRTVPGVVSVRSELAWAE